MTSWAQTPLRTIREAADLSLRDLEAMTGIPRGRLSSIERGMLPTTEEASKILAALRAPVADPALD